MPISARTVTAAADAVRHVKSIDDTIQSLRETPPARMAEYGDRVRNVFGCNRLSQFRDMSLGELILCSVINVLLAERRRITREFADIVDFAPPPCPEQTASLLT